MLCLRAIDRAGVETLYPTDGYLPAGLGFSDFCHRAMPFLRRMFAARRYRSDLLIFLLVVVLCWRRLSLATSVRLRRW